MSDFEQKRTTMSYAQDRTIVQTIDC